MNPKIARMRDAMATTARLLVGQNMRVTQEGSSAYVALDRANFRPTHVNIPLLPDDAGAELVGAIQGYLDHEAGHLLFTDWSVVAQADEAGVRSSHNVLEDTFVEREMCKRFPGSRANLEHTHELFCTAITPGLLETAKDNEARFHVLIVPAARAMAGQARFIRFMADEGHWRGAHMMAFVAALGEAAIARMPSLSSSSECLEMALLWAAATRTAGEKVGADHEASGGETGREGTSAMPRSAGDGSGSTGGEKFGQRGEGADSEGRLGEPAQEGSGAPEQGQAGDAASDPGAADPPSEPDPRPDGGDGRRPATRAAKEAASKAGSTAAPERDGLMAEPAMLADRMPDGTQKGAVGGGSHSRRKGGIGRDVEVDPTPAAQEVESARSGQHRPKDASRRPADPASAAPDPFEAALSRLISERASAVNDAADYRVFTRDGDRIEAPPLPAAYQDKWLADLDRIIAGMAGTMQRHLELMMAARTRSAFVPALRSGRLHAASLHLLAVGDDRTFRRKVLADANDTAVTLLVDNSGSMKGKRMLVAMASSYALAMTLERIGIPCEVIGYTTDERAPSKLFGHLDHDGVLPFSRYAAIRMPVYKPFDQKLTPANRQRFAVAAMTQSGTLSNVDGESLQYAALRLLRRREARRIVIVLSDGKPAVYRGNRDELAAHLAKTVRELEGAGIEVVGIGIMSSAVREFYPRHLVLDRLEDLPATVIGELRRILRP